MYYLLCFHINERDIRTEARGDSQTPQTTTPGTLSRLCLRMELRGSVWTCIMPIPRHSDVPLAEARGDKRCFSRGDNKLVLQDEIEGTVQI